MPPGKSYDTRRRHGSRKRRRQPGQIRPKIDRRLKKVFARIGVPEKSSFKPDLFQVEALEAIHESDCLVTAPTGAGKTWIAESAIDRLQQQQGAKSWYACPLKALSNAKYTEFRDRFGSRNVGILTGDRKENPNAPLVVGTTEILRNQLYDAMHRGDLPDLNLVVLDEAHFLGDPERGVVWEEVMIYLPPRIPLLLLSATVGNPGEIAEWLEHIRQKECRVIQAGRRPVPLQPLFFHPNGTLMPLTPAGKKAKGSLDTKVAEYTRRKRNRHRFKKGGLPQFTDILKVLRTYHLLPVIFFLKSRADCDRALTLCRSGSTPMGQERQRAIQSTIRYFAKTSPHIGRHRQRWHLENLAVGAHHSGQLPSWKLVLEKLMTDGLLEAVFATTTVAAGVNFPARTVGFLNSDRFNGVQFAPLGPTEFHQMTGRAGRRGMDNIGFALILPGRFMDVRRIASLVDSAPEPIKSQIRINFSMVLNLLLSHQPEEIRHLLAQSFAAYPDNASGGGEYLWRHFLRHLRFLKAHGYVNPGDRLTNDGKWAAQLRVDQPLLIAEALRRKIFPHDDPALLAAMVAAFVSDREFEDAGDRVHLAPGLETAFETLAKALQPLSIDLSECDFSVHTFYLMPAVGVHTWASGKEWGWVRALTGLEEGDLARLIIRTADNLRHFAALKPVFPGVAACAAESIDLLLRDPVASDYF
jgi:superfamily II RNA helicase